MLPHIPVTHGLPQCWVVHDINLLRIHVELEVRQFANHQGSDRMKGAITRS